MRPVTWLARRVLAVVLTDRKLEPVSVRVQRTRVASIRAELLRVVTNDLVRGGARGKTLTLLADDIITYVETLHPETLRAAAAYIEERDQCPQTS